MPNGKDLEHLSSYAVVNVVSRSLQDQPPNACQSHIARWSAEGW